MPEINRYGIFKIVSSKQNTDGNENITSEGFESTNFNSKFKAKTAIDIILITFYGICILVFGLVFISSIKVIIMI